MILRPAVPAALAAALRDKSIDVGLIPSIDYQQAGAQWQILPIAAIVSEGPVLTVRIFSRRPIDQIDELACDTDSHTSVVLARIIWRLQFNKSLQIHPLRNLDKEPAVLLIGDKVLPQLGRWSYELDLGEAWTCQTALPFVYAFWTIGARGDWDRLADILHSAYRDGLAHLDQINSQYAARHGFTEEQAKRYFVENIHFQFGPRQRQGLERFYRLAYKFGFLPRLLPLRFYSSPVCREQPQDLSCPPHPV